MQVPTEEEWADADAIEARIGRLAHTVCWLSIRLLSFSDSTRILREVARLRETPSWSQSDRLSLLEQWAMQLWLVVGHNPSGDNFRKANAALARGDLVKPEESP